MAEIVPSPARRHDGPEAFGRGCLRGALDVLAGFEHAQGEAPRMSLEGCVQLGFRSPSALAGAGVQQDTDIGCLGLCGGGVFLGHLRVSSRALWVCRCPTRGATGRFPALPGRDSVARDIRPPDAGRKSHRPVTLDTGERRSGGKKGKFCARAAKTRPFDPCRCAVARICHDPGAATALLFLRCGRADIAVSDQMCIGGRNPR